uniref:Protein translocase subunit SecY n=1 Tax=Crouania attenuata TaxID=42002 RepID=A0A4D6WQF6_9FLOR|nr:SecY-type transporter protein [Crouania attenuata]
MRTTKQLTQKIIITLSLLIIARLGIFIPIPGIDHESLNNTLQNNSLISFLNIFSGGGFSTIGIFALGIVPYINSSIIIQLFTKIIPELEKQQKEEGEVGRQKVTRITRYLTLVWAIIQSYSISVWLKPFVFNWNNNFIIDCVITLTTGSIITMWFSEIITEYGIGNGTSLLIFQNIISNIPKNLHNYIEDIQNQNTIYKLSIITLTSLFILIINILIQEGKRKISIVSAKQLGKINELNPQSYLPLKLNQGGVMPIIFASASMALPSYIYQQSKNYKISQIISLVLPNHILYFPLYGIMIISFSYFYSSIILNTRDIANNLKKMGATIPTIRPGTATINYLNKIINKLTFIGATFLFLIAFLPSLLLQITQINVFKGLGATSLLILVGVAIDTAKQIQTYIISQQYDNMMK